jgi:hypothetical protein
MDTAISANPSNATVLVGYQSSPNSRGTLDIVQSCALTIFLCTYTSMCLNVKPHLHRVEYILYKVKWVLFTLFCPELVTAVAAEQWRSARQSRQDFRSLLEQAGLEADKGEKLDTTHAENALRWERAAWTETHGFFTDMGGVQLLFRDSTAFPVNAYQLHWLVANGHIDYPNIEKKAISDKDKADIFARTLTLLQVLWFTIQCIARGIEQLSLTTLELLTLTFSWCAMHSFYFWYNKPLDVDDPVIIPCNKSIQAILEESGQQSQHEAWYLRTPLDFVAPPPRFSYVEPFFQAFVLVFNLQPALRKTPVSTFDNTMTIPPHGLFWCDVAFSSVFVPTYCAIHLVAWNFTFPTSIEKLAWRTGALVQVSATTLFQLAIWPGCYIGKFFLGAEREFTVQQALACSLWPQKTLIIPIVVLYFVSRAYIIVEGFLSLRRQPEIVYQLVDWWALVPHL